MPHLKKSKKRKQVSSELDIFLTTGMEVFSSLNKENKKNNHKSQSNSKEKKNLDKFQKNVEKRIDVLIAEYEKETKSKEFDSNPQKELEDSSKKIVETRDNIKKKTEMPCFEVELEGFFDTFEPLDSKEDLLEIEKPSELNEKKPAKRKGFIKQMFSNRKKTGRNSAKKLPRIKIRSKDEVQKLKNRQNKTKQATSPQDFTHSTKDGTDLQPPSTKINIDNKMEAEKLDSIKKKAIGGKWKGEDKLKKTDKLEIDKSKELEKRFKNIKKKRRLKPKRDFQEEAPEKRETWNSDSQKVLNDITLNFEKNQDIKKKSSLSDMHRFIIEKKEVEKENSLLDAEIKKVLTITDNLLGKLPEKIIDEFVKSKDFELYEKIVGKYKIK